MGESTTGDESLDDFLRKTSYLNSLHVIRNMKESEWETTSIVEDIQGKRFILKTLELDSSKEHPYELLENHTCAFLPKIYLALRCESKLSVVMELLEGENLREIVEGNGPLNPTGALQVMTGVIRGVDYLHTRFATPLIHRDIKPDNIIVINGEGRLVDFGIMRAWQDGASHDTTFMGTDGYAAPEQFGYSQTDARTDIYGLGMSLRFALTAKRPREECKLDASMQSVIDKAIAFDPSKRYGWVGDFYADFKAAVNQAQYHDASRENAKRGGDESSDTGSVAGFPENQQQTEETAKAPADNEDLQGDPTSQTHPNRKKPKAGWRVIQVFAAILSLGFALVGAQMLVETRESNDPIASFVIAIFAFAIPLLVLADPFDVLRKRGLFDKGTGKRMLQVFGIGFAACFLFIAIESVIIEIVTT